MTEAKPRGRGAGVAVAHRRPPDPPHPRDWIIADLEQFKRQGPGRPSGRTVTYICPCPCHADADGRHLTVYPDGKYYCFSHQCWGRILDWAGGDPRPTAPPPPAHDFPALAAGFVRTFTPTCPAAKYLTRRGIPYGVAHQCAIGYAPGGTWPGMNKSAPRLVIPLTDIRGYVTGLQARYLEERRFPERYQSLGGSTGVFNAPAFLEPIVVITEGPLDALSVLATGGPPAVALRGGFLSDWRQVQARMLVLACDQDDAGREATRRLRQQARAHAYPLLVEELSDAVYGGHKDLNAAHLAGVSHQWDWAAIRLPVERPPCQNVAPVPEAPATRLCVAAGERPGPGARGCSLLAGADAAPSFAPVPKTPAPLPDLRPTPPPSPPPVKPEWVILGVLADLEAEALRCCRAQPERTARMAPVYDGLWRRDVEATRRAVAALSA